MKTSSQGSLAVKAGILIIIGILILLGLSFRAGGQNWFQRGYRLYAEFPAARGIDSGTQVTLVGVPVGRVSEVEVNPRTGNVLMTLLIDEPTSIPRDSVASIRLRTLLGNYHIYIEHGQEVERPLAAGQKIQTEEYRDLTDSLHDLANIGADIDELFGSISGDQQSLFNKISEMLDENRADLRAATAAFADGAPKFSELMENLNTIASDVRVGTGTLARLTRDDELYLKLSAVADDLSSFTGQLEQGRGALGRLVADEELARQLDETIANAHAISGTLREVVEANREDLGEGLANISSVARKIDTGEGSLGRLVNDPTLYNEIQEVVVKVNRGEGTLGQLINDPELYEAARDAVVQLRRTFEEGEEQGVMRTFLGVLVGGAL